MLKSDIHQHLTIIDHQSNNYKTITHIKQVSFIQSVILCVDTMGVWYLFSPSDVFALGNICYTRLYYLYHKIAKIAFRKSENESTIVQCS